MVRNRDWQKGFLSKSLEEREQIATSMREQSKRATADKSPEIMDVNQDAVAETIRRHGITTLIHGHTHRPGRHRYDWGCRYVLGAWEHCGWIARQSNPGAEPVLECIALKDR